MRGPRCRRSVANPNAEKGLAAWDNPGMRLADYMYAKAEKDGSEIAIVQNTIVLEPMMGNAAARYEPDKFVWLGVVSSLTSTCVMWKTSPVLSMEDAKKKESIVGGQGSRSSTSGPVW